MSVVFTHGLEQGEATIMTLKCAEVDIKQCMDPHATPSLVVLGEFTVSGVDPIFVYASRLAHTLPSDPEHCAIVWEWVEMERQLMRDIHWRCMSWLDTSGLLWRWASWIHAKATQQHVEDTLTLLEDELAENVWLDGFENSTAADFCWIARLRRLCRTYDLSSFPRVCAYARRDPTLHCTSDDARDEAASEADTEKAKDA